ncbi:MAG: ornithine cyclodeaminase family protein [Chloroflexota bacterium]|nr:ornithine cyclodeaminase family protein [Chloroflexota bacterium]
MRTFDAATIRDAAPIDELLDAVEDAYRDVAAGRDRSPIRSRVEDPNGDLLVMPGLREGGAGTSVKVVTVVPANAERGLPTVQAVVLWLDTTTGEPIAVLDGTALTAMRTGAASGVGTRLLARPDASVLAVIGAGGQADWQVRAVSAARPIREVRVFSRTPSGRDAFAARLRADLGSAIRVIAAPSAEAAIRAADVVCCATTSSEPVFDAAWLTPGAHVNGIGAFRLGMVELPAELFSRATLVAVDSRDAALAEAGDLVAAIESGHFAADSLVEIGTVDRSWALNRDPEAITVFKSVGLAIQDVAAAEVVMRHIEAR